MVMIYVVPVDGLDLIRVCLGVCSVVKATLSCKQRGTVLEFNDVVEGPPPHQNARNILPATADAVAFMSAKNLAQKRDVMMPISGHV